MDILKRNKVNVGHPKKLEKIYLVILKARLNVFGHPDQDEINVFWTPEVEKINAC